MWCQKSFALLPYLYFICQHRVLSQFYEKNTKMTALLSIFFQRYMQILGLYFPIFGLNTEIYSVNFHFQSEYRKFFTQWLQFRLQFAKQHTLDNLKPKQWEWSSKLLKCKFILLFLYFPLFLLVQVCAWRSNKSLFFIDMLLVGRNSIHSNYYMILI